MGEPVKVLITKRQSPLKGEDTLVIAIWAGVSSTTPSLLPRPHKKPATQAPYKADPNVLGRNGEFRHK